MKKKVKAQKKNKLIAQSQLALPVNKVTERKFKDKVNIPSYVKSTPKIKKIFPKKENKDKKGFLYIPSSERFGKATPLIVVDAGHGGKDYGAKSRSGIYEKKVNLTINKL